MNQSIIIIPVYKPNPDKSEVLSFNQCLKILYKHPISIITYKGLDISYYTNLLEKANVSYKVEYFEKMYFESISGYNRLMLSSVFYRRFKKYLYMLIYQLDAWVFRDELEYWCNQGFDYIGAPWIKKMNPEVNEQRLTSAGNGGFSLRKINTHRLMISFYYLLYPVKCFWEVYAQYLDFQGNKTEKLIFSIKSYFARFCKSKKNEKLRRIIFNEDGFWAVIVPKVFRNFKVADANHAIKFSFEENPSELYRLNGNTLPFGCHAWERYDHKFWEKFII